MKKIDVKQLGTELEGLLFNFNKLTQNYENKEPNVEVNLSYEFELNKTPQNIQFFASDLGTLPYQGTLEDFEAYFRNARASMVENNIDSKHVNFDFGGYGQESGVKVKVFGDEKVANYTYMKEIKNIHDKAYDLQQEVNETKDAYVKMHQEYKKAAPSVDLDKAHNKLIKPLNDIIKISQDLIDKIDEKIIEHTVVKKTKKQKFI